MFNLGGSEVIVILLIALIVLGPEKLPDAARKVGNVMGELRRMSTGFQQEFRDAVDDVVKDKPAAPDPAATPAEAKLEAVPDDAVHNDMDVPKVRPDDPAA
jgi:sec-independent protein translocase protein TatB